MIILKDTIKNIPNDMELGYFIRSNSLCDKSIMNKYPNDQDLGSYIRKNY